ncbi:hypothetical protein GUJ93_ZPchr0006g42603 [Zizania palustris]|uniref:Uncharacterized protein n=1 Tax=Zizania palustris TaxID=103762 RepID=A0A8J5SGG1_ZIZPA|nr:hypothetical protein GUJ93_ZPchr0006g42603 [Zizania palustris]
MALEVEAAAAAGGAGESEELVEQKLLLQGKGKGKGKMLGWPVSPRRVLQIALTKPEMSGYEGPAWSRFFLLDVFISGDWVGFEALPVRRRDIPGWEMTCTRAVGWDWQRLCLELVAQRCDSVGLGGGKVLVFRQGGPHTSDHTAVTGRARVPLLDALAPGCDGDGDSDSEGGCEDLSPEGTRVFKRIVKLQGWRMPAPGEAGGEPRNVVLGEVSVVMRLTVDWW